MFNALAGDFIPSPFFERTKKQPFRTVFPKKDEKKNFKSVLIGGVVPQMITNYTIII